MQLLAVGSKFTLITQGKVGVGLALTLASKENLTKGRYRPGAPMQSGVWRRIRVRR